MTREYIENFREIVLPFVKKRLLEINYEGLGKSDAKMFAKDFDEILNLAIKGLDQEYCEDVVRRAEVKKIAKEMYLEVANMELDVNTISDCISYTSSKCREVLERKLQALSSVTTIRPKGHWIEHRDDYGEITHWHCSNCYDDTGFITTCAWDFCPNCGSDNREVEEE